MTTELPARFRRKPKIVTARPIVRTQEQGALHIGPGMIVTDGDNEVVLSWYEFVANYEPINQAAIRMMADYADVGQ